MVGTEVLKPRRDAAWFFSESTPLALAIGLTGAASVVVAIVGPIVVLLAGGVTPVASLVESFRSGAFSGTCVVAAGVGVLAAIAGAAVYRRMPTKLAREEAVGGAILGVQGALLGLILLAVAAGSIQSFSENFLDFNILEGSFDAFLLAARNTLHLAFVSELLGIAGGLMLAVFVVSKRAVLRAPARVYINFFRGTPLLWQLSFFGIGVIFVFPSFRDVSTFTIAIVIFSLNTAAYAAEVFRSGIQSVERGQMEAARGLGMSYAQAMRYAVLPQAFRRVIPPLMNEFVILIKDTSLVLVLGLATRERELMSVGQQGYLDNFNSTFLVATALGYLAICLPLIRVVNVLERRLRSGLIGVTGG